MLWKKRTIKMQILPIIITVVLILVIAGIVVAVMMNREAERKKRVVGLIQGRSASGGEKRDTESDKQNKRRAEIAKKLKESKDEDRKDKKPTIGIMIEQAGFSMSMTQYWILSFVFMIVAVLLAKIMGQGPMILLFAAIIGFLGLPRLFLKKAAARRQKKFLEEFPDALEATVRLLKAGMPISEAIAMISKEFEGPVGEEMSRIYDKQKIGVPLHEAAMDATKRIPLTEMQMFATGMAIQAQTGSSLSEVLMNLSGVIRSRFRLKRKVKALSSEAIASASIIAALPCVVAGGLYFVNYEYISILFTDPFGKVLLTGAIVWMGVGVFIMKQMINFKV